MRDRYIDPTAHLILWAEHRGYCLACCFFDCNNCDLDDANEDGCCCGRVESPNVKEAR